MRFLLPNDKAVLGILSALFGDDTRVSAAPMKDLPTDWVAIYVGDDNKPVAACVCNKEFVAWSGSALTMLPAGAARESISGGAFTEVMVGSFQETMNICSRFFMSDSTPHLRLSRICPRKDAPELAEVGRAGTRKDFQVAIPRYGSGQMACVVT